MFPILSTSLRRTTSVLRQRQHQHQRKWYHSRRMENRSSWRYLVGLGALSCGVLLNGDSISSCFYSGDLTQMHECVDKAREESTKVKKAWLNKMKQNVMCIEFIPGLEPVLYLMTRLRDKDTSKEKFVHYVNRLAKFTAEISLANLHHKQTVTVHTPRGDEFRGVRLDPSQHISVVSILRSGDALLPAYVQAEPAVSTGKLLITRYSEKKKATKHPVLYYSKLPKNMRDGAVVLLDPIMSSGETMKVALKELTVEHKVHEEEILVVNILACKEGIENVLKSYPKVRVLTVALDDHSANGLHPGIGVFGDRYFGSNR